MRSVATVSIAIAVEPACAFAIPSEHECEHNGHGNTDQHLIGVISDGQIKVVEELHALHCHNIGAVS